MHSKTDAASVPPSVALSDHQLAAIRADLDKQRRLRVGQLDELSVEAARAAASTEPLPVQVSAVLKLVAESALDEIDAALKRLEVGSYGTCESCTDAIPWERLEVLPSSRLCTPCRSFTESARSRHTHSIPGPERRVTW
jgi:DnaK suppressor protein